MNLARVGSVAATTLTLLLVLAPESAGAERIERSARSARTVSPVRAVLVTASAKAVASPDAVVAASACPSDMVEVEGEHCPVLDQPCVRWMDPPGTNPRRCAEFAPSSKCQSATVKKHFCVDKFEYPNRAGENPTIMKSWNEAAATCNAAGKRLCGESEWTLACEGQQHLPYPYGTKRDAQACNIDKPHPAPNERALASANAKTRDAEVARLWQGEASGSRAACVSSYGAFDMTGNVDEWVVNESGVGFKSGLKGGYWGPVRDRCRAVTTAHAEDFKFYQIGFRCCSDAGATSPAQGATAMATATR